MCFFARSTFAAGTLGIGDVRAEVFERVERVVASDLSSLSARFNSASGFGACS